MTNIILAPHRAQYAPALQPTFIRGADRNAVHRRPLPGGLTAGDLDILNPANPHLHAPFVLMSWGPFIRRQTCAVGGIIDARDRAKTTVIGDSGGYQFIGAPDLFKGQETVRRNLGWAEHNCDLAMTMDIPTRSIGRGRWTSFDDCLTASEANLKTTLDHRSSGRLRLLNVLQGRDWTEAARWFEAVRQYPLEGWAFGGATRELPIMLRLVARMVKHGIVGQHLHVLGTSSLSRSVELSALKAALHAAGHEVQITFDTATPSIVAAKNQIVTWMDRKRLTADMMKLSVGHKLIGSDLPFLVEETRVGKLRMGDLMVRGGLGQSAVDGLSHLLLTHHNIHQLMRLMEQANRLADQPDRTLEILPDKLVQRLRTIEGFLTKQDPEARVRSDLGSSRDTDLEDEWEEDVLPDLPA
ncbi:hypothetical protein [Brevundimonas sp.]